MFKYGKKKPQGATRHVAKATTTTPTSQGLVPSWLLVGFGISVGLFVASGLYWWQPWQPVAPKTTTVNANTPDSPKQNEENAKFVFYDLLPSQEVLTTTPASETPPAANTTAKTTEPINKPEIDNKALEQAKQKSEAEKQAKIDKIRVEKERLAKEKVLAKQQAEEEKAAKAKETSPNKNARYTLQAGSFKSLADADRRRASVMMSGLPVKVQKVTIKQGEEWYRVVVGPFTGEDNAKEARQTLQAEGVDSLMVKNK